MQTQRKNFNKQVTKSTSVFELLKSFHNFQRLKTSQVNQAKVEQELCHPYEWFMEKAAYLELSPPSSFPLRTSQMSSSYLNSLAMSGNTSITAALHSMLQVISKNKTKRMKKKINTI